MGGELAGDVDCVGGDDGLGLGEGARVREGRGRGEGKGKIVTGKGGWVKER